MKRYAKLQTLAILILLCSLLGACSAWTGKTGQGEPRGPNPGLPSQDTENRWAPVSSLPPFGCDAATQSFTSIGSNKWIKSNNKRLGRSLLLDTNVETVPNDQLLRLNVHVPDSNPTSWTGAELVSTKKDFHYGRYEARFKGASGQAIYTGFFTYDHVDGTNINHEIDIELLNDPIKVHFTVWTRDRRHGGNPENFRKRVDLSTGRVEGSKDGGGWSIALPPVDKAVLSRLKGFNGWNQFHNYAFDWQSRRVDFYIDEQLICSIDEKETAMPSRPGRLILNAWIPGSWAGQPRVGISAAEVNWVWASKEACRRAALPSFELPMPRENQGSQGPAARAFCGCPWTER